MIKILIHSPIHSQILAGKELLRELLSHRTVFYVKFKYDVVHQKWLYKRKEDTKKLFNAKGVFYTGLLSKIKDFAKRKNIPLEIIESKENKEIEKRVKPNSGFELPKVKLYPYQERFVNNTISKRRGLIVASTGAGKTMYAMALMKAFSNQNILFLCPNLTIVKQTVSELKKYGFKSVCVLSEGNKNLNGKIAVSNIQTFSRINLDNLMTHFGVIICDEIHIASGSKATYDQILSNLAAPIRVGLTATLPTSDDKLFTLEGLFGPIIDTLDFNEGRDLNVLADVQLKLVSIPYCSALSNARKYSEIYQKGIVEYSLRNRLIIREALNLIEDGNTVLIFIVKIEHGKALYALAQEADISSVFIHGETSGEEREQVRNQLQKKQISLVIASVIWREGVNIPSLNAGIIAAGNRSQVATLQSIGRILRKAKGKESAIIIDFIDVGKYLSEHFCERLQIYKRLEWI